ncbi:MAG: GGDEF domain-containing protein [Lachnospiraceae bacterium]|nr:GGDEF domain-containing protein [Lachnospiraceae bacterium]
MNFISKIKDILLKDVDNENETKKAAVMLRFSSIIMCVCFLCHIILFTIFNRPIEIRLAFLFLASHAVSFWLTYRRTTKAAIYYMACVSVFEIFLYILLFGWNCGFQQILYSVLIMMLLIGGLVPPRTFIFTGSIILIEICFFFFTKFFQPMIRLSDIEISCLHIISTFTAVTRSFSLITLFSKDSVEMERKLINYNKKIEHLASVDPLTGLLNRRAIESELDSMIKAGPESYGNFINFAIGDIDFFKKINDTYGHEAGDLVLKSVAAIFKKKMEGYGHVARWGGEEFLFVFLGINGDEAVMILEELRNEIKQSEFNHNDTIIKCTMTFGLEEYNHTETIEHSIDDADKKLYLGKESGRDQVVF